MPTLEGYQPTQKAEEESRFLQGVQATAWRPPPTTIDLSPEFNTPDGWAAQVRGQQDRIEMARAGGAPAEPVYDARGFPAEWDYKSAQLGPFKEPLPARAVGWLPNGKPDFGGGLDGELKRLWHNFYDAPRGGIQLRDIGAYGPTATNLRDQLNSMKLDFETWPAASESFLRATPVVLSSAISYLGDLWGLAEDNETIFGKITQLIGGTFDGVFTLAMQAAVWAKRDVVGPRLLAADELIVKSYQERGLPTPEWHEKMRGFGALTVIPAILEAQVLSWRGFISVDDYRNAVSRNREAARMAYSIWMEPALKEEFEFRRMQNGEDPRLLAMELESPGAEAVGETIFDPFFIFDLLTIGHKITALGRARRAVREVTTFADPDLKAALNVLSAAQGEPAVANAAQGVLNAVEANYAATRAGIVKEAGRRAPLVRTAGGKRTVYGQRAMNFLDTLIGAADRDPDTVNSVLKGLIFAADPDLARRTEGLAILSHAIDGSRGALTREMLFSQSANETAILMRGILTDADGAFNPNVAVKILEDAGGDPAKLVELLDERMGRALEQAFPTVQEQIARHEEYASLLQQDPPKAASFLARHPLAAQEPSPFLRALAAADETAQRLLYRPMGAIQGTLFMGLNPTYRAANRWGNFAPMFVDLGPGVAFKGLFGLSPNNAIAQTANHLGGVIPEGMLRGISPGGALRDSKNWLKGVLNPVARAAAKDEARAAGHVVARSVRKTMTKAYRVEGRLIKKAPELSALSGDQRSMLARALRDNYGDWDKAIDALRAEGGDDIVRNLHFLSEEQIERLEDLGLYDEVLRRARENESADEILRSLDELEQQRREVGRAAAGEPPIYDATTPWGRQMAENAHVIEENISPAAADLFDRRVHETRATLEAWERAVGAEEGLDKLARLKVNEQAVNESLAAGRTVRDGLDAGNVVIDRVTLPVREEIRAATATTFLEADAFRAETRRLSGVSKGLRTNHPDLRRMWLERNLGPVPEAVTAEAFRDALWDNYRIVQNDRYILLREQNVARYRAQAAALAGAAGIDMDTPLVRAAENQLTNARLMDRAELVNGVPVVRGSTTAPAGTVNLYQGIPEGQQPGRSWTRRRAMAETWAGRGGTVRSVNVPETDFRRASEAAVEENIRRAGGGVDVGRDPDEAFFATEVPGAQTLSDEERRAFAYGLVPEEDTVVVGTVDDAVPSPARVTHETAGVAREALDEVRRGISDNWGRRQVAGLTPEAEQQLSSYAVAARGRMTHARAVAINVANQTRDFILHNYGDRYGLDLVAGYVLPYQFWHSRTYAKWMQRLAMHPALLATYARYRKALEDIHAGLPDWWKYNINVSELLGIETEHPLWFNLERSLNPLNGLTGVDFEDPKRRLDAWSATLEDVQKFGPSTWLVFQLGLALKYHMDGEDEAAARWAGRLWSPSRAIRDITALMDPKGLGVELDPFINYFGGGIDPWERARVGRQLAAMVTEGRYSEAQIVDAAHSQQGPIWEEAWARAINVRAPNVPVIVAPFFLGTGFKPRTEEDIQIDRFYSQMYGLFRNKPNLSPEEYRQAWADLEGQYPYMDALLLAKKSGFERDEALAWSVLDRIPPGMSDELAERVGMNPDAIGLFYESKGDLVGLDEADRLQFMGGILKLAALLDIPDNATKAEWDAARSLYRQMRETGQEQFGENIWDKTDTYFALFDPENPERGDAYLSAHPEVTQALDWQQFMVMSTPLLGSYYTSEERIRKFYKRQMYETAEVLFGSNLWDHFEVWSSLKDMGDAAGARRYWQDHPQLGAYVEWRDDRLPEIEARVNAIGDLLPEAAPPVFRGAPGEVDPYWGREPPVGSEEWVQRQVMAYASGERLANLIAPPEQALIAQLTAAQWRQVLGDRLYALVLDFVLEDEPLSSSVRDKLDDLADRMGIPGGAEGLAQTIAPSIPGAMAPSVPPTAQTQTPPYISPNGKGIREALLRQAGLPTAGGGVTSEPEIREMRSMISSNRLSYSEPPLNPAELERRMRRDFPGVTDAAFALMRKLIRLAEEGEIDPKKRAAFFSGEEGIVVENYGYPVQVLHELGHAIQYTEGITNDEFLAALKRVTGKEPWVQSDISSLNPPRDVLDDPEFLRNVGEWFATIYSLAGGNLTAIAPGLRSFYRKYAQSDPTVREVAGP